MRIKVAILLTLLLIPAALGADYLRKAATDYAFPVILVDATDGYTAETEKKAADTTVTYGNITDANSMSAYTDDDTVWKEMGDGTGEYRLIIGASEFSTADKDYLVKVVVSGCRTVRFVVHTVVGTIGNIATTDDGGTINVGSGRVESNLKVWDDNDLTAASWNTTTHMLNVDVNWVESNYPISGAGYSDLGQIVRMQLEATVDDDPNANSIAKRVKDNLTGDIAALVGTPAVDLATDLSSVTTDVNEVAEDLWTYATRTLTVFDEDDTTIDMDGVTVNATATLGAGVAGAIADAVWDEMISDHWGTHWSAGWVMKALMGQ